MEAPFIFGKLATDDEYTDRQEEMQLLKNNFTSLINTIIISPRRWGKSTLVNRVAESFKKDRKAKTVICRLDIFNCRTEQQFYNAYANAILKSTTSAWEEFVSGVTKYLGKFIPKLTFSDVSQTYEFSFGLELKDPHLSIDEILDLPQKIAMDTDRKIVVCIDEFQNVHAYPDSLAFQQQLRAHWQLHSKVCYCLYGSKRHLLMNIFNEYEMPFYRFGDMHFLQKIKREEWVKFITKRFKATGKHISAALSGKIADTMQNHPYYVQQYSQQIWLRTQDECNEKILDEALNGLIDQLSLLFTNIIDSLKARQISFLLAIVDGETSFTSQETLQKYNLGSSANVKNLKNALLEKDIIDIIDSKNIEIQDPVFQLWIKKRFT
ncbi:MAG: ATPase [Tannerella sp.]|jgi:AAA+ ATPase superfamily predicted ATPase|nr:ATPase [Tannerella sp.]